MLDFERRNHWWQEQGNYENAVTQCAIPSRECWVPPGRTGVQACWGSAFAQERPPDRPAGLGPARLARRDRKRVTEVSGRGQL
jgi:hypothetical protein